MTKATGKGFTRQQLDAVELAWFDQLHAVERDHVELAGQAEGALLPKERFGDREAAICAGGAGMGQVAQRGFHAVRFLQLLPLRQEIRRAHRARTSLPSLPNARMRSRKLAARWLTSMPSDSFICALLGSLK